MSAKEIRVRVGQELRKRTDALRAWVRLPPAHEPVLKPPPADGRFYFEAGDVEAIATAVREAAPREVEALLARCDRLCEGRYDLLGARDLAFGDPPDWRLDPVSGKRAPDRAWPDVPYLDYAVVGDHKYPWELGRHQHLVALARAWRLTSEKRYLERIEKEWRWWSEANRYPHGIHWTSALEVAVRSLSWMWLLRLLQPASGPRPEWLDEVETAIGISGRYLERFLSAYFSPNTHLLGEAAALYAIGTVHRRFQSAAKWRELGRRMVLAEAERQVRPDGFHFEQSTYYHVYTLDILLHFHVLARRNADPAPPELERTLERMGDVLRRLSQGGLPPMFGDDDGGRWFEPTRNRAEHLLDPLATLGVLLSRRDMLAAAGGPREETFWLLGVRAVKAAPPAKPAAPEAARHDDCGYHALVSTESRPRALVLDAGPHGALAGGHGHADALSLQMLHGGRRWLLDPGTFCYPVERPERNRYRGTAAHNTVVIDGRDQAEPDGPFSWKSFADAKTERWFAGLSLDLCVGSHEGYRRLPQPATHRRWAIQWKDGLSLVRDEIDGSGRHLVEQVWHLGPGFRLARLELHGVVFETPEGDRLSFAAPGWPEWTREVWEDEWSPAYGAAASAPVVRFAAAGAQAPTEFAVALAPGSVGQREAAGEAVRLESLEADEGVAVYRLTDAAGARLVFFRRGTGAWRWQGWESDAAFVCWMESERSRGLVALGASRLTCPDGAVYAGPAAERIEWRREDEREQADGAPLDDAARRRLAGLTAERHAR